MYRGKKQSWAMSVVSLIVLVVMGVCVSVITGFAQPGALDASFAQKGVGLDGLIGQMAIQSDGKIVIGGAFASYDGITRMRVARLNTDGTLDNNFSTGSTFNGGMTALAIQKDGKILVGHGISNTLIRLNIDGSIDRTFAATAIANGNIYAIAVQNDGKILVGGSFTTFSGFARSRLVRLHIDGTIDTSFVQSGVGLNNGTWVLNLQSDGKILVGGDFTSYNGIMRSRVARLNTDGTLDSSFVQTGTGLNLVVSAIALQNDGKIVVGGLFNMYNSSQRMHVARLNSDGTLDNSFSQTGTGLNNTVFTLAIQSDGKIIVGGSLTNYNGSPRQNLCRLNANGSLDNTFVQTGSGLSNTVRQVLLQNNGDILVGGEFMKYNGIPRLFAARLKGGQVNTGQDCNTVTTFAGSGTSASVDGVGTAASFIDPIAVTTDKSGNVYVTDGTKIRKITPSGVVSTFAGAGGGLGAMNGIAIDGNGNLFAIEQTLIRKVTPAGAVSTVPIIGATISNGSDIAVDAFGNLYISDGIASIYKIAPNGVAKRLNNQNVVASGIAVDAVGNVYCGGYNTHKVFKVAVNGTVTTVAGSGIAGYADGTGTAAQFNEPVGVTLDASGNLYVMDYVGSRIRKITPGGIVSTIAGSGVVGYADGVGTSAQFNYPLHLALDTTGNLFVTDRLNYRIRSINVCGASGALPGAAAYSGTTFLEATANNGSISTTQTITLGRASWSEGIVNGGKLIAGTHFTASNVPAGLTAVVTKISASQATISFSGSATQHTSAFNVNNVRLTFTDAALNNASASSVQGLNGVSLSIAFRNLGTAVYSGTVFPEAAANTGTITTTRTITLSDEQWTSAVGISSTFVAGSHYTATGVPAGLQVRLTKTSATVATLSFTGTALAHQNANDSTITLTFLPQALASLTPTEQIAGLNRTVTVDFQDNPSAFYSGTSFVESAANNGTVSTTRTITLAFDTFVPTGAFTSGVHFSATGVPAGLTLSVTRTSQTVAQLAFTGSAAAHESLNDATIGLSFSNAAVVSGNAAAVVGLTPKTLTIDFADAPQSGVAVYSDSTFVESANNNGSVNTVRTLTLNGDSFVGVNSLVLGTHFTATGVPPGLTLNLRRTSPTMVELSLSGAALAHNNANDAVVTLTFLNAALVSGNATGIIGLTAKRLFVDFADPTCGAVTTFAGNGNAAVVDGAGVLASFADPRDIATDAAGNVYVADKTCVRKITPSGIVTVLAGSATASGYVNGIGTNARFGDVWGLALDASGNVYVADERNAAIRMITPNGIVSTVAGGNGRGNNNGAVATATFFSPQDVAVDAFGNLYIADFGNNAIRKISGGIVSTLNTSPITNGPVSLVADVSGYIYVAAYNSNKIYKVTPSGATSVIAGSGALGNRNDIGVAASFGQPSGIAIDGAGNLYVCDYYPYGLIRKITPSGIVSTIAGAGAFGYADGIGTNAAFNYPWGLALDASGNLFIGDRFNQRIRSVYVCGASGQFPLVATYSGTVFPEAVANNGTITTTQTITLAGTTWSSAVPDGGTFTPGTHYNTTAIPDGMTFSIVRDSPTKAQLVFSGSAAAHANINDTSFVLTFLNAALANGSVSAVTGLTPKTLMIDFNDPPIGSSAAYSDVVFSEIQANNGQVTTARTVTLTNASFASGAFVNGTHFTASGVPDGLTLVVTRLSATQARLSFTGTAAAHALANSTDVTLTFLPAVLTGANVGAVAGLTPKMLRVNFLDPYTASYSDTTFAESIANNGTVPTVRTLTLVGANFTTTATTLVQGTHFNVSGVPAGLTLSVTKTSSNVAQIAFSGAAAAHVVDVNNITLSFLNAALESGSGTAAAVMGLTPKKFSIDFIAPYTATYSAKNFVEGPANDGTVPTVRTLTLFGGDSLLPATLLQGAHFTATGVPSGLTMVMTRTSSTTAQISFTGTATNHANVNDASVSVTFTPEALASGNPSAVVGLTPATLTIDFRDPDVTPPSSPNILGFTPQVGTTGTVVTISGFGFTGTQNVLFGGAPAKSFTVVSDSTITAVVDYGSTGDVTVVNAQGFAILPGFTYVPRPVISSFTPTTGNAGAVVTITGSNFQGTALNGTSWTTTSVYFGGTPATSFTVLSPTQIQATVDAGATGAVRVETLPGNVGVRNGFCYMAPLITAFTPTSASTGTQVVIRGSNFTGATAVKFNGKAAASFAVVSDTEITAFPATGTPLTGSISVTTPQCTDDLATFTFIPAPIIYGFWLSGGTDGDVITIDGVNFTGASGVKFGDTVAASYTVLSPTRIQAVVGSGKTGAVSVIGPGGVGSRSKFIYYAPGAGRPNPPIITSFTPTEGPDGTVITINGLNFQGADWYTTAVRIGDAPPVTSIIQSMTPTQLKVKVNGGNTGRITVYTPAGVTTSTMSFTYFPPPTISAFTPTTGAAGTTVTILGTEFTGVTSVKFGGVNAASYTVDSPTQITAAIGSGNTGRIQVVASGGTATSSVNFTLPTPPPVPTVTTFSPAIATTGTVITINGTNFTGATQVTFGGTPAQSFMVVNASRITAVVGGGASGSVAVTTPSGSASKTGFTYLPRPLPTITSFAPASASPGQTVTILGTYFTGATQVFMGSASVPFTVIHSGKITVEVPTNAASGVIRVVTPDGVALRSGFTFIPLVAMLNNFGGAQLTSAPPSEPLILAGRSETAESVSLGVYPNPATDVVTLTATGFGDGRMVNITLLNTLGQTILTLNKESIGGNLQTRLDVREVASGAYTAVLSDGAVRHVVRFVKR